MRPRTFLVAFFCVHLVVSIAYYFLASQSQGVSGGRIGLGVFGAMAFLLSGDQPAVATPLLPVLFLLNSAVTAGLATGIFVLVRRLRAA